MRRPCDRLWQVDATDAGLLSPSDVLSFERHRHTCAECNKEANAAGRLRSLLEDRPSAEPTDLALRRVRARVLRDAMPGQPPASSGLRSFYWAFASMLMLGALIFASSRMLRARPLPFAATVTTEGTARWLQSRESEVERVDLREGIVHLHVRKQSKEERFLVDLPDGEIEVRGTTFEVEVRGGATRHVQVQEGVVTVRIRGRAEVALAAGETWPPAVDAAPGPLPEPSANAPRAARFDSPMRDRLATPARSRRAAGEGTRGYAEAIELYQGAHYSEAAEAFAHFASKHPTSSLDDDALFLEALSLASVGRLDAAALVAGEHVQRFPASFHKKDAAILVARAARDRGDCREARRALATWWAANPEDGAVKAAIGSCSADPAVPQPGL